jgi:hypothetical protein
MLVASAPSQWVKVMMSAPAMPGKRYMATPEYTATSPDESSGQVTAAVEDRDVRVVLRPLNPAHLDQPIDLLHRHWRVGAQGD